MDGVSRFLLAFGFASARVQHVSGLVVAAVLLTSCSDRQHRNPFDPETQNPIDVVRPLDTTAGDGQVNLEWDYTHFEDIVGVRIHRQSESGAEVIDLSPGSISYIDTEVKNAVAYDYRLTLVVEGEGERDTEIRERATPGTAIGWVADSASGLVWRLAPDGRNAVFAQGRFPSLTGIAIDARDRSCWVGDSGFDGLYRIAEDGGVQPFFAALGGVRSFAIESHTGFGWVIDDTGRNVWWFQVQSTNDSLDLTAVDATFREPTALSPAFATCWIVDEKQDRVILYHRDGTRIAEWIGLNPSRDIGAVHKSEWVDGKGRRYAADAWVLVDGGLALARLSVDTEIVTVGLPFGDAVGLEVDAATGDCWVLGLNEVAVYGANGTMLAHWQDLPAGLDLSVDPLHRQIWLTGASGLWKLGMDQSELALLGGFGKPFRVFVDPGLGP